MRIRRSFLAILSLWATAANGEMLPDPVDLKAAFCIGAMKDHKPVVLNAPNGGPLPPNIQAMVDSINQMAQDSLGRLRSYLVPRVPYLDSDSLILAISQGEMANADAGKAIIACGEDYGQAAYMACVEKARKRIKDCFPPDFLPY